MPTYKKYFKNKFILNGVELNNVSIGASVVGKFEEPLDEAGLHLPFTTQGYEYPMRGLLQIISEDYLGNTIDNTYIILRDAISEGSKYGEWKHDLRVMEYSGKYDAYLYHTFTYTKALKNNNPAPFEFLGTDLIYRFSSSYVFSVFLDTLPTQTTYFANEDITIKQLDEALQPTVTFGVFKEKGRFEYRPALIRIDGNEATKHEISSSDYTFQLTSGRHYIEYGFNAITSDFITEAGDKWLYKFYVNAIPKNELSVYDALTIIRDSKPFESLLYHERTRLFDIDPTMEEYLKSVELPQMFIQKATMRQILNTIFSYINAISRFIYDSNGNDKLSMDEFNKITGLFDIKDVMSYSSSQEAGDLFNHGVQWVERGLPSSFEEATIVTPSEAFYKTVRSTKSQITDTAFELALEAELYLPIKFSTQMEEVRVGVFPTQTLLTDYVLDLTPRLINREEWLLKNITVDFPEPVFYYGFEPRIGFRENKVSNLYWQQGSTSIVLSEIVGELIKTNIVFTTIQEAMYEELTRNTKSLIPPDIYFDTELGETLVKTTYLFSFKPSIGLSDSDDFRKLKFQLQYISFENFAFQTHRENRSNSLYYTEGRINQSDKALNIAFSSMKAHGDTQRSGVPSISFSKVYDDYTNVLRWGMIDQNDYVIVEEKFEYQNEYVVGSYVATKDHNRLSLWTGVDQEYRWTEIPRSNQVFERHELFNENIVVSNPSTTYEEQNTHIKDLTLDLIFGTLINDWKDSITNGNTKVTLAHIRTDGFLETYPDSESIYNRLILTPVRSFGGKHGFSFIFGFEGNQVALDKVERSTITDQTTYYNKAVRYTDANGEFKKLWYSLATQFYLDRQFFGDGFTETERNESYPLSRVAYGEIDSDYTTHQSGEILPNDQLHNPLVFGKKDKSQSIKVSIQNSIYVHDYKEYVFGLPFYTNNFIVNNPEKEYNTTIGTSMYLYIYENGTKYNKFDTFKIKPSYESQILLVEGTNVSYANNQFRFNGIDLSSATSWAIGDDFENLYMACNFPYEGFNTARLHFTPDHTVIGNKTYSATITINKEAGVQGVVQVTSNVSGDTFIFPTSSVEAQLYLEAQPEIYYYEIRHDFVQATAPINFGIFVTTSKYEQTLYDVEVSVSINLSETTSSFVNENYYVQVTPDIKVDVFVSTGKMEYTTYQVSANIPINISEVIYSNKTEEERYNVGVVATVGFSETTSNAKMEYTHYDASINGSIGFNIRVEPYTVENQSASVNVSINISGQTQTFVVEEERNFASALIPINFNGSVSSNDFEYQYESFGTNQVISISDFIQVSKREYTNTNVGVQFSINIGALTSVNTQEYFRWAVASGTTYDTTFTYSNPTVYNASYNGCATSNDHISLMPDPNNYPLGYRARVRLNSVDGEDLILCSTYAYYIIEPDV